MNLIPTPQGGTHVNGMRTGLTDALREFCEFRNLLPRGIKLAPEDVWEGVNFVLSVKIEEPQFSGQTKERLSSRECATLVGGLIKDHFALWLNQHPETGDAIAQFAIENAQHRLKAAKTDRAQAHRRGARAARQARGLHDPGAGARRAVPRRGRFGRRLREAGARPRVSGRHAAARQDPEHLGGRARRAARVAGGPQHQHRARRRSRLAEPRRLALPQDLHPRGRGLRRAAHRDAVVRVVPEALRAARRGGARLRRDAAAVPRRRRQRGALLPRRGRARRCCSIASRPRRRRARSRSRASRVSAR